MKRLLLAAGTAIALISSAAAANATVRIDISQAGGDIDVAASGSLDLTGATFDHQQPYTTGIISGGSNWYVALGTTPGMDWYQLTSTQLPFGTDPTYHTSGDTTGDAISIWGESGIEPLVGVTTGYVSGTAISATMTFAGQTIAGLGLTPGVYTFTIPNDTIVLDITGGGGVPEPATWAIMFLGCSVTGAALRGSRRKAAATA